MAPEPRLLAFYGTLMSRFDTLERLGVAGYLRLLGDCEIAGVLYDVGEWPTLVTGGGVVRGELFEVLEEGVFARLDPFEDYRPADPAGSSFLRARATLIRPAVEAWVYVSNEPVDGARLIPSGSWYDWLAGRPGG